MARKKTAALKRAADDVEVDLQALQTRCESILGEDLYWFPVRHHSPTIARYLERVLLERKPKVIFLEAPAEANELIPHVIDAKTKPPVAIYSSYRDDNNTLGLAGIASSGPDIPPRFSCWYPMLEYSPEYVALRTAKKIGAEVVFMDLPHHALIKPLPTQPAEQEQPQPTPPAKQSEQQTERLIVESSFYQSLAENAGYRSWNEAWDSLFETRPDDEDIEEFRREMTFFCGAARATSDPKRVATDGTLERERFMLQTITKTLKRKRLAETKAMVVCGGFHLFLDRDDKTPPPELPEGTVYTTVVPYSFFRVSELSGYGAGNRAPQFYQLLWDLGQQQKLTDVLVEHVVAVLKQARRGADGFSSADAIAVCQNADLLARLRGRRVPVLDDIQDALITCCCKGKPEEEGVPLLRALDHINIGNKLGQVTPAIGRLPIVTDFYNQLGALDLGEVLEHERRIPLDVDKREEIQRKQSVFLHRVKFLAVPIATLEDTPSDGLPTGQIFREKWAMKWSPQVEPALIELNLYGDTVEAAALSKLREDLAGEAHLAGRCCQRLVEAIDMDFPNLIQEVEEAAGEAIDSDPNFISLAQALTHLTVLDRYAVYRSLRRDLLEELTTRCYDRACFGIPEVASVPEDQQAEVVEGLMTLAELVQRERREGLDRALFVEHVRIAGESSAVPFLRGVFLGLLTELRAMTPDELASEVTALARGPVEHRISAGDFLDGVLSVSRTSIMLGADALLGAVDELLRASEWEVFLVMLPKLRGAFERLHDRQRESLAVRVAEIYGLKESEALTELHTSVGAAARIANIDQQVARIMEQWDF